MRQAYTDICLKVLNFHLPFETYFVDLRLTVQARELLLNNKMQLK